MKMKVKLVVLVSFFLNNKRFDILILFFFLQITSTVPVTALDLLVTGTKNRLKIKKKS